MKIKGVVISGKKEGKKLGFPTANINLSSKVQSGVYRGEVEIPGEKNIFKAAVFVNHSGDILEAHILDFKGDLYGKEIEVKILEKIREVVKFENDEQMKKQISEDVKRIDRKLH